MIPLYALITYILFGGKHLYYAEALVMTVYMLGFMSVFIVPINLLSFILPNGVISIMEVVFLVSYNTWTNLNFFNDKAKWWVIVKSVISIVGSYLIFNTASNLVMRWVIH